MKKIQIPALLLFLATTFLLVSCKSDKAPEQEQFLTMESGYKYLHHIQTNGRKPQPGEVAYYYFILKADDSLMMNGRDAGMISKTQIAQPLASGKKQGSPTLEGLKLMSIGDSMTVIVPVDSIKGLPPGFENYENFYYDLVLIDIKSKEENAKIVEEETRINTAHAEEINALAKQLLQDYESGKLAGKVVEKPSGLKYYIHEEGAGGIPQKGETVQIRYHAMLATGQPFDSSFPNASTFPVKVGAGPFTKGLDEALTYLPRGSKAMLFVPYVLGYGEEGVPSFVPPKADLVYYIEMENK